MTSFQLGSRRLLGQDGFTLIELLVACAVISVALVAVSYTFSLGIQGVEGGRQRSTAVFLAQQRMEQIKASALKKIDLVDTIAGNFLDEAYGSMSGSERYRRTARFIDVGPVNGLPAGSGKRVDVDVFYRPITGGAVLPAERSVRLSGFLRAE